MNLGEIGVIFRLDAMQGPETAKFASRLEKLGYRVLWLPEGEGREPFSHAAYLLGQTETLVVATGIANVWVRDPMVMAAGAATLAELSASRFILGLGVSHAPLIAQRGHTYDKPYSFMRDYLAKMKSTLYKTPKLAAQIPVVLAALRPKMQQLAASETRGTLLAFVPPDFTAKTRATMGVAPWICVDQLVVLETDAAKARATARARLRPYVPRLPNYTNTLRALGWSDADFADGCSDRLVDTMIAWGTEDKIREHIRAHHSAGATHVCIAPLRADGSPLPDERALEALAPG